ncbi:MAG: tRNA (adenosine(37)-N6)-threonylcarbamoyltransferase complex dimerization subunit type 1 TsaB [Planctomycetia bacterium]|nr:tRNA (adenosine(37)-N6)-threonylcarbamoyltransferase complex dimerization subunit type 1 TsaB [Planctomycetia bacterium]
MKLIAVETSTRTGSVAVADGGKVLAEETFATRQSHGRDLLPTVDALCRDAGWSPRDVGLVAVSIGPGSFTGIRIAVVFAKVLAMQTGAKIVAVDSLRSLAENAPAGARRVAAILDAKRSGLFAEVFERRGCSLVRTYGPEVVTPEEFAKALPRPAYVMGDGLKKSSALLADCAQADESLWMSSAATVARLGWALHEAGEHTLPEELKPLYIRRPEAEVLFEKRKSSK